MIGSKQFYTSFEWDYLRVQSEEAHRDRDVFFRVSTNSFEWNLI